jgi:hypothetical protein
MPDPKEFTFDTNAEVAAIKAVQREKCADGEHEPAGQGYDLRVFDQSINFHVWICIHCRNVYVPK